MRSLVVAMAVVLLLGSTTYGGWRVVTVGVEVPKPAAPAKEPVATVRQEPAATVRQEPAKAQQIDKLIRQLGNKDYYVRQRAQDDLARMGFDAFDALMAATTDEDMEIASRAKYLLRLMRMEWTAQSDPPEVKRCLQDYKHQDAKSREERMQALIGLPDGQGIEALCRLVRFEKSSLLSKTAAATILLHGGAAQPPEPAAIKTVRQALQGCRRSGALWLAAWAQLGSQPEAAMAQWPKLLDDELKLLRKTFNSKFHHHYSNTAQDIALHRGIIVDLTRFQAAWLKKLGKTEEATAAARRLVELVKLAKSNHRYGGNATPLMAELLPWLIEQKEWKVIDELVQQFGKRLPSDSGLLYLLAEAYDEQGRKDEAQKMAGKAFGLHPGKHEHQLLRRLRVAQQLSERGRFDWARRELEYVIAQDGADENVVTVAARTLLAEMLHDQGQDLDAAAALEKLVQAIDAGKVTEAKLYGRKPKEIRSRMHYFFACRWEAAGEAAKQRECLDQALRANPADVDVLIACYRLSGQPPEHRAKIVEAIKTVAARLRKEIAEQPDAPSAYNQYAWLIGNTEGDFDEALKFSRKSLELRPNEGGYYDTLAHVYFGKGDLKNAVKYQTKAAELEPHSGLIRRKLELFRKKLEENKT